MMKSRTVTRSLLSGIIASKCSIAKKDAERIITETFSQIRTEVRIGNRVKINNFGIFDTVMRKGKIGNDITRKKQVIIPPHKAPVFRASSNFKNKILNPNTYSNANNYIKSRKDL